MSLTIHEMTMNSCLQGINIKYVALKIQWLENETICLSQNNSHSPPPHNFLLNQSPLQVDPDQQFDFLALQVNQNIIYLYSCRVCLEMQLEI